MRTKKAEQVDVILAIVNNNGLKVMNTNVRCFSLLMSIKDYEMSSESKKTSYWCRCLILRPVKAIGNSIFAYLK